MSSIAKDFLDPPRQKKIVLFLSRQIPDKNGQIKTNLPKIKICLEYENRWKFLAYEVLVYLDIFTWETSSWALTIEIDDFLAILEFLLQLNFFTQRFCVE